MSLQSSPGSPCGLCITTTGSGCCNPRGRARGYRVYTDRDLERLEQIVALKFIGLPLNQIKALLDRQGQQLADALDQQYRVLEEKRRLLDRALDAIREAQASEGAPRIEALKKIIEVMEMQTDSNWMMKYYSEKAVQKIEARKALWSPELQAETEKAWRELYADIDACLDEDPASPRAQALASRWSKLVEGFTGGDPQIAAGLRNLYQDRANWPADFQQQMQPFGNPRAGEFMQRVLAARGDTKI